MSIPLYMIYSELRPLLSGIDKDLLNYEIKNTVRDFCKNSGMWVETLENINVTSGVANIDWNKEVKLAGYNAKVVQVNYIKYDDTYLKPQHHLDTSSTNDVPLYFYNISEHESKLIPTPSSTTADIITAEVVLIPDFGRDVINRISSPSEFNNSTYWLNGGVTYSADSIIAPDGTLSADKMIEDTGVSEHSAYTTSLNTTLVDNTLYTFAVNLKYDSKQWIKLKVRCKNGVYKSAYFDVLNNVPGSIVGSDVTIDIDELTHDFYVCSMKFNIESGASNPQFTIALANSNGGGNYSGDGTSAVYIQGATVTPGTFDTDTIPDFLYNRWVEQIKDGVLGRLYGQPGKTYTNLVQSQYHLRRFQNGIAEARDIGRRRYTNVDSGWKYPSWA